MNSNERIERLQKEIEAEKAKMSNCRHEYDEPFYDPETVREPYGSKLVGHGSDVWSEPQGYHDVRKDRWTRICIHCGKKEHSYELERVIIKTNDFKPKFS